VITLLIDADPYAYKYANRNQTNVDWDGDGESAISTDIETAKVELKEDLDTLVKTLKADHIVVCLTDYENTNFRKAIFPGYKSKRGVKPLLLPELRTFLAENWKSYIRPTLEADDVLGILATHPTLIKGQKVIVSIDKDMKTVPGFLYNPDHEKKGIQEVGARGAYHYFMTQVITGDQTDNYPGCPGAGPKAAEHALTEDVSTRLQMWQAVVGVYEAKGLTEEDAIVQARCARILQSSDYDYKRRKMILWMPPKK
jgi:DNA polymerase-1